MSNVPLKFICGFSFDIRNFSETRKIPFDVTKKGRTVQFAYIFAFRSLNNTISKELNVTIRF